MASRLRIVHFLNQFFGGLGGEEAANTPVQVTEEPVGPGRALQLALGDGAQVVATIISGDNYFNEEPRAAGEVRAALEKYQPDVVVAGPALNAGRYGLACSEVCTIAQDMEIGAVTGMYHENPGVLDYKRRVYIVPTGETPADLPKHLATMANIAKKLGRGEKIGPAEVEGYMPRGIRRPGLRDKPAAVRAVGMLTARLHGRPFQTELPIEAPEVVSPAAPVADIASATIGLVTSGGLVPKGNPDRMVRGGSKEYFKYSIARIDSMSADEWESVHRGFFTGIVNENPNYILPLHVLRGLENRGAIGQILNDFFSVTGVGTSIADSKRMGEQMAGELKEQGVDAVIMVAT
jgi:betaine reductase